MSPTPRVFGPVANTSECQVRYTHGTNRCENGFAYKWTGAAPSATELLNLATEVGQTIGFRMQRFMHVGVQMREVYCRNVDTEIANQATFVFPTNATGARNGSPVASNEAAGLIKRTGLTGRKKRGRNSFSEFIEGDVDGNTMLPTLLQFLADLALSILAQRVAGRFTPSVASRALGTSQILTSVLSLDSHVDSQKTRLNNHGD